MNRRKFVLALAGAAGVAGLGASSTLAQNWNYRRYKRVDVDSTIRRCERSTDQFVHVFDNQLDKSPLNDTEREDKLNEKARDLENAMDKLREDFNRRGESWWESRETAREALHYAKGINNSMRSRRYRQGTEQLWWQVRTDLNRLAYYFGLPGLPR